MPPNDPSLTTVLFDIPPVLIWLAGIAWLLLTGLIVYIWLDQKGQVASAHARINELDKKYTERFERVQERMNQALQHVSSALASTREDYVPRLELQRMVADIAAGQARIEKVVESVAKSFRHDRLNTAQRLVALEAITGIEEKVPSYRQSIMEQEGDHA